MRVLALCLCGLLTLAPAATAQSQGATLADIRQDLSVLLVKLKQLKRELSTTGGPQAGSGEGGPLARLDAIEAELAQLTDRTERLEFRIERIVEDGTNRIGDLEFRLCELESACDPATLDETPLLGGVDVSGVPDAEPAAPATGEGAAELAVGEQADFDRARAALADGAFETAAERFASFIETYPGGPLGSEAHFRRGEALTALGRTRAAARAYLESFSGAPGGAYAPPALLALGRELEKLGQTREACLTLGEVGNRFPSADAAAEAATLRRGLDCG